MARKKGPIEELLEALRRTAEEAESFANSRGQTDPDGDRSSSPTTNVKNEYKPTIIQNMIIGQKHEDLPNTPPPQSNWPIIRQIQNLVNALSQRRLNRALHAEDEKRAIDPVYELQQDKRDERAAFERWAAQQKETSSFGDKMAGKDQKEKLQEKWNNLTDPEKRERIKEERKARLEEIQERLQEKVGKRMAGVGMGLMRFGKALGIAGTAAFGVKKAWDFAANWAMRQNRDMAQATKYSGQLTTSFTEMEINQMKRDIRKGQVLGDASVGLNKETDRYRDATEGWGNMFSYAWKQTGTKILQGMSWGVEKLNGGLEMIGIKMDDWKGDADASGLFKNKSLVDQEEIILEGMLKESARPLTGTEMKKRVGPRK